MVYFAPQGNGTNNAKKEVNFGGSWVFSVGKLTT